MIIDFELEQYQGNEATVTVIARKGPKMGQAPTYKATYEDGSWKLKKGKVLQY
jgi:hypothetical protein